MALLKKLKFDIVRNYFKKKPLLLFNQFLNVQKQKNMEPEQLLCIKIQGDSNLSLLVL